MKPLIPRTLILLLIFLVGESIYAQSAKKYYKIGKEFEENKKYEDAIDQYSKAIETDAKYVSAYVARANSYKNTSNLNKAVEDYLRALTFDSENEEFFFNLSKLYFDLKQYEKSIEFAEKTIAEDKKHIEAFETKAHSQTELKKYNDAIVTINEAIEIKKTSTLYFIRGNAFMGIKDWKNAETDFKQAIVYKRDFVDAYVNLSITQVELGKIDIALTTCNRVLGSDDVTAKDVNNVDALVVRASIYKTKLDYSKAINDLSKALLVATKENKKDIYNQRGLSYLEFGQPHSAITDFNAVLLIDKDNFNALYSRAAAYEAIHDYKKAILDYEALRKMSPYDEQAKSLLKQASQRLFELNREEDKPIIVFIDPKINSNNNIPIPNNLQEATVTAKVSDVSKIKLITVAGKEVPFDKEGINPEFSFKLTPSEINKLAIVVSDVYDNEATYNYTVLSTEIVPPKVKILSPYASDDGEIYLENENSILYIEGIIEDESAIKSVHIDGATASFLVDHANPSFSATVNIGNKKEISISAVDIYGNSSVKKFTFNREGAQIASDNPMGKTWVVFIENSNYKSFASLEGPSKDVREMKSALANYQVHNVIKKKDLTKTEFERFFSIELRDLVRSNKVNSILVWYAGHGKFLNESGYWIPVDAQRDDEFTYFNINSLKAAMQSYSKYITHTLVVTDACESGPSFYQAMRSTGKERDCNDWQATRFKSSQVFSSAGYELASDNSQFTKTFSNSLQNNPDACISIEKIVNKVREAVESNASQKPKFGKIDGLEDEDGTFFFIKR